MLRRFGLVVVALLAAALISVVSLAVVVIGAMELGALSISSSTGGTLENGRSVNVESDSWYVTGEFQQDTATIRTDWRKIEVVPDAVKVNGETVAEIAADAKSVNVELKRGELSVTVDGEPVVMRPR
jgi:hypothetical protein